MLRLFTGTYTIIHWKQVHTMELNVTQCFYQNEMDNCINIYRNDEKWTNLMVTCRGIWFQIYFLKCTEIIECSFLSWNKEENISLSHIPLRKTWNSAVTVLIFILIREGVRWVLHFTVWSIRCDLFVNYDGIWILLK